MSTIDHFFQKAQFWIRSKPILYRFTLGIRILLAFGFIPTGMVKLLGYRFTTLSVENEVGAFFEILYQSGLYWNFLGLSQVIAGILVLIPAVSALGALIFLGIMVNIFFITISLDFAFTPVITFLMLLATTWLVLWDYNRFRALIFNGETIFENQRRSGSKLLTLPQPTLANSYERAVYAIGTLAGLLFFGMLRGLSLPAGTEIALLAVCFICFVTAIISGFRNAKA